MASLLRSAVKGRAGAAAAAAGTAGIISSAVTVTFLSEDAVPPAHHPWRHMGFASSYDHGALRRGFQVYRQVCAACHSIEKLHWRDFENVTHTKDQLKKLAATYDYPDGPNDEGEMFERPGKFIDWMPKPYPNDAVGRLANNGALPPDLSLITKGREHGQDYLFSLLTGYSEPPAGKPMMQGLHYNPYFPGGAIAMPPPLEDGQLEYEDGTEATVSQMARDVVQFLDYCAQPEAESRKSFALLSIPVAIFTILMTGYAKRRTWSIIKSRQISYYNEDKMFSWKPKHH